jgi:hypothetical protein
MLDRQSAATVGLAGRALPGDTNNNKIRFETVCWRASFGQTVAIIISASRWASTPRYLNSLWKGAQIAASLHNIRCKQRHNIGVHDARSASSPQLALAFFCFATTATS